VNKLRGILRLALFALAFSVGYGFIEYYVIQDTTFGYDPVLFSLVYPYHFGMAAVFGLAAYCLLAAHGVRRALPALALTGALTLSMLAAEDFTWFALRASAPLEGDANGGMLVMHGEWTTRFMGSTDAYFMAVPNWYFLSLASAATALVVRRRQPVALVSAP
jgi:hypothetical protein